MLNPDYKDMLRCLSTHSAEHLIVGAYDPIVYACAFRIWIFPDEKFWYEMAKAAKKGRKLTNKDR